MSAHGSRELRRRGRRRTIGLIITALVASLGAFIPGVSPAGAVDNIAFRASAQSAANRTTHRVTIPASVRETDGMLLFVTSNRQGSLTSAPAGWTLEESRQDVDVETFLYSKVAIANDAGRNAAVSFSTTTKATLTLLAYDGTATDPTALVASAAESRNRTTHTTPGGEVTEAGSWVVSYWADKSSGTTSWTIPPAQVRRSTALVTGPGRVTAVASDLGVASPIGTSAGVTATSNQSSGKSTMWTVVLRPDPEANPNVAPVAAFTVSCPQMTCTVDASSSTDTAPGTVASHAWTFGDGSTGTGVTTAHTYETTGPKTITLVVTDDQGLVSAPVTRTANPDGGAIAGGQPVPDHDRLVPERPRTNTPRISNGEIWDIEVIPQLNRVFIAGSFTSAANTTGTTTTLNQPYLLSYNYVTGLIDRNFRPTFSGGGVTAVEATPDGSKLFVAGSFNAVNGVARQKVASLDLTTGAPIPTFDFSRSTNNQATALAASNDTLYVGGRFSRVNGTLRTGLAAVDAASGAVNVEFDNQLSGGIGVNGQLRVAQLKLTHDNTKLLVVHTGRQIDGQDRYGMGLIDTATKQLLPWRSTLWDDNLARVGGVTRIYAADIAPDDSYFVVGSGSGGDAPPISDTIVAYSLDEDELGSSNVEPLWISRHFDSIYSLAVTEVAVYTGGHFGFIESASADDPWPGLDNVGYGTGQGLAGYGLGDQVVRRDHIAALNPADGKALEWYPMDGSNSFEGDKAMEATPRGLFIGGDGMFKGGVRTGRVGFFDFNTVTYPPALPDTSITTPIEGRVVENEVPFTITGSAQVASGNVGRVEVSIQDRGSRQYLQDNGSAFTTTFSSSTNTLNATLEGTGTTRTWSIPATIMTNRDLLVTARTVSSTGSRDTTPATKRIESFGLSDTTPTTSITGPGRTQTTTTFTVTGTAADDLGVNRLTYWFRDEQQRYLQADGTVDDIYHSFSGEPDVIGATAATWSYEVTLPHEGIWRASATAIDTTGQADLRSATRDFRVDSTVVAPILTMTTPVAWAPPQPNPSAITMDAGSTFTVSGTAADEEGLKNVEVSFRNSTSGESLGNDCTWGVDVRAGNCRISPVDISGTTYNWSWEAPAALTPGSYSFSVRATDDEDLGSNQGRLTLNVQIAGDAPPNATMSFTAPSDESLGITLTGTATDDQGVASVRIALQDDDTGRYLQPNGTMAAGFATIDATLDSPGATSTTWSLSRTLPTGGDWDFVAYAFDTSGQQDVSTSGATAGYTAYPDDDPPALSDTLGQPKDDASFTDGRIVVTGRAEDSSVGTPRIASVQVAVINDSGRYMSSSGTFNSTSASYRNAFLNSPGSAGSNYSFTTPVIPAGTYRVDVRPVDDLGQVGEIRSANGVVVTQPENLPPVASATVSCVENVCTFDARGSTDENTSTLTYSWNFGQGSGSGPVPVKRYTAPSPVGVPYTVTLTVRDEWTATATTTLSVEIVEPAGNVAPVPTFTTACTGLTCGVSSTGTADPDTGDTITSSWDWGDGTSPSSGSSPSAHVYAAPGEYTITLTTMDGWGKAATTTRTLTLTEPAGNAAPTAAFTATCTANTTCSLNAGGSSDPDGDGLRYTWTFSDASTNTTSNPALNKTFLVPGSYTATLVVTDVWGKASAPESDEVTTMSEPAGNTGPVADFNPTCDTTTRNCRMNGTASDPDGVRGWSWDFGDGVASTTTSSNPGKTYAAAGTYTITGTVRDVWGQATVVTKEVTLP